MKHQEFMKYHQQITKEMYESVGIQDGLMENVEFVEKGLGVCTTYQGMMTRIADKFVTVAGHVRNGVEKVGSKTVEKALMLW